MDDKGEQKGKELNKEIVVFSESYVTVTKMNHIVEVQYMKHMNTGLNIKRLNENEYIVLSTGEIKKYKHSETRADNHNSLRQTFKKMRYIINNNFVGAKNELFVTLTYKENMTDTKQLYTDTDKFFKRLKYAYKDKTTIDYMTIPEPQGRGAWHLHILLRFNDLDTIFIPNKFDKKGNKIDAPLFDMWGHGFVKIKSVEGVDNIGAYLSAYLTDMELTEENIEEMSFDDLKEVETKIVDGKEKKMVKGGRLSLYPPKMRMYRKSKGILEPDREKMKFKEAKKIVGSAKPHYTKNILISDKENDFENEIKYLGYNLKREN